MTISNMAHIIRRNTKIICRR